MAVKFGAMDASSRERLVRWVFDEANREVFEARRGRLCAACERPVANGSDEMHPTCAAREERKAA